MAAVPRLSRIWGVEGVFPVDSRSYLVSGDVTEFKLIPRVLGELISQVTRCWGKESNFIQKASKTRRCWTNILKNHLEKVWNSGLAILMSRERGNQEGFEIKR